MSGLKIGVTNLEGQGGFTKKEYFTLVANADNLYRVLPPLHSLAEKGQFAKYHASHKIFLVQMIDGKPKYDVYNFLCIERVNKSTKIIETHCPFCDKYRDNDSAYKNAKAQGVVKEDLEEFFNKNVRPYQVEKKFYINAVNQELRVGVLPVPIKAFGSLQERLKEVQTKYQLDATGTNGLFLNFKKTQKFKGDRDTSYSVDLATDVVTVNGVPQPQLKQHVITKDFLNVIEAGSRDLGSLMQEITAADMAIILNTETANKKAVLDKIFGRGQKPKQATSEYNVGGTDTVAVTRIDMVGGNPTFAAPEPFANAPRVNVAAAPATAPVLVQTAPVDPFKPQPSQFPVTPGSATAKSSAPMTDEEFMRTFGAK